MGRGRDGLASKVMKFNFSTDDNGKYIPTCTYQHHRGIVLREYVCEQRQCRHFLKLYFDGHGKVDEPGCYDPGERCR